MIEDETLGETLRVTVIATGFKEEQRPGMAAKPKTPTGPLHRADTPQRQPTPQMFLSKSRYSPGSVDISGYVNEGTMPSMMHGPEDFDDPLDIPTFQRQSAMRKK